MTRLVTVVVTVMAITPIAARAEDVRASAADQSGAPVSACALLTKDVLATHHRVLVFQLGFAGAP